MVDLPPCQASVGVSTSAAVGIHKEVAAFGCSVSYWSRLLPRRLTMEHADGLHRGAVHPNAGAGQTATTTALPPPARANGLQTAESCAVVWSRNEELAIRMGRAGQNEASSGVQQQATTCKIAIEIGESAIQSLSCPSCNPIQDDLAVAIRQLSGGWHQHPFLLSAQDLPGQQTALYIPRNYNRGVIASGHG